MQPYDGDLYVKQVLSEDGSQVGVKFQDTGPGISPDGLNSLFEPFYTTKPSGLGLGLSISFELIQRNNGRITVESTVGQGTAFTVWLPLANTEQHSV
ncbi:MAG: Sensory box histidine kinase/response regulator [Chloroflexi bacterium]|jgi:signal transduction histidine kinase|nr:Sensory box histidine kinase/response regulator [Chloroflexota bacterium]